MRYLGPFEFGFAGQSMRQPTGPTAAEVVTAAAEAAYPGDPDGTAKYARDRAVAARQLTATRESSRRPIDWDAAMQPSAERSPEMQNVVALGELAAGPAPQDMFSGVAEVPTNAFVIPGELPQA